MAHIHGHLKSKTKASDKNRFGTTWSAFTDARTVSGLDLILDACAEPATAKCGHFIDRLKRQDALALDWSFEFNKAAKAHCALMSRATKLGSCATGIWCNPPFDDKLEFIKKAYDTVQQYKIPVLMMLPYERQSLWWQVMVHNIASKVYLPDRRYKYYKVDGKTVQNGVNFASAFIHFENTVINTTQYVDFNVQELRESQSKRTVLPKLDLIELERQELKLRRAKTLVTY